MRRISAADIFCDECFQTIAASSALSNASPNQTKRRTSPKRRTKRNCPSKGVKVDNVATMITGEWSCTACTFINSVSPVWISWWCVFRASGYSRRFVDRLLTYPVQSVVDASFDRFHIRAVENRLCTVHHHLLSTGTAQPGIGIHVNVQ